MKYFDELILLALLVAGCNRSVDQKNETDMKTKKSAQAEAAAADTTPKVTGIGGIFFTSENPKATMEWYGKNLGLAIGDY